MLKIRNWRVNFMDETSCNVTEEESRKIMQAWNGGAKGIMVGGQMIATHQILSIVKDNELGEDDAKEFYGLSLSEVLKNPQLAKKYQNLLDNKSM